jgi:hypothetical protein
VQAKALTFVMCVLVAANTAAAESGPSGAEVLKYLTGTWKASEDRTPKNSALDEQVFGRGAAEVRNVTLVVSTSGDADLQIRRSVVGSKGRVFAPSVTEVRMQISEPVEMEFGHPKPTVTVTSAEERYLDGDRERWTRDGVRVSISIPDLNGTEINLQFETPDGRGAFGATLTRSVTSSRPHPRSRRPLS